MMLLCFLSRALQLARHSSSPLGRQLCSASANKPVLTLFTKVKVVYRIKLGKTAYLSALIYMNPRGNGLAVPNVCSIGHFTLEVSFTPGFTAQSYSRCSKQLVTTNKWRFLRYLCLSDTTVYLLVENCSLTVSVSYWKWRTKMSCYT